MSGQRLPQTQLQEKKVNTTSNAGCCSWSSLWLLHSLPFDEQSLNFILTFSSYLPCIQASPFQWLSLILK
jgi:hypothetical protein